MARASTRRSGQGGSLGARVAQAEMRAANMGLILRHLRSGDGWSRARLASETGLSRATVSSVVAELAERGLVREGQLVREGAVGRPGQTVSLDGARVAGIGLEISVNQAVLTAVTLAGTVIREAVTPLDAARLDVNAVLDRVAAMAQRSIDSLRGSDVEVVGVTLSPPGIIDYSAGSLRFAPNLGWRGVPLAAELAQRLGSSAPMIHLENDAKLAALAEHQLRASDGVHDLVHLTGEVGVGAGIIVDGRLLRGWSGFSGEVGHLPLGSPDVQCACGRRGCWETAVGIDGFLRLLDEGDQGEGDRARPLEDWLFEVEERARAGDRRTLAALAELAATLAPGLSILVDVLNPQMIVLGGYYAHFAEQLLPPVREHIEARRIDAGTAVTITTSTLGATASARGGALLALEGVFEDPSLVGARA
ncbi:MAG: ROK family transcriptional regulator [Propionibacteriaceae bacterium]|nr:ROK family transcriptional regulator [Propionibacteriaceae bacterium]